MLKKQKQWLSDLLLKTQDLIEFLPDSEKELSNFPLKPAAHLTKEFYLGINYLQETSFYKREDFTPEQLKREAAQEKVWLREILPFWKTTKLSKQVKSLWRKGLPPRVRAYLWKESIGNTLGLTRDQFFDYISSDEAKEIVRQHVTQNEGDSKPTEPVKKSGTAYQIQIDVVRTFSKLNLFNDASSKGYADMVNVLSAVNHFNQERGYVQGMSYLAGMFLMYMDAADSFIYLSNLLENDFFKSFCSFDMDEVCCLTYCHCIDINFNHRLINI